MSDLPSIDTSVSSFDQRAPVSVRPGSWMSRKSEPSSESPAPSPPSSSPRGLVSSSSSSQPPPRRNEGLDYEGAVPGGLGGSSGSTENTSAADSSSRFRDLRGDNTSVRTGWRTSGGEFIYIYVHISVYV